MWHADWLFISLWPRDMNTYYTHCSIHSTLNERNYWCGNDKTLRTNTYINSKYEDNQAILLLQIKLLSKCILHFKQLLIVLANWYSQAIWTDCVNLSKLMWRTKSQIVHPTRHLSSFTEPFKTQKWPLGIWFCCITAIDPSMCLWVLPSSVRTIHNRRSKCVSICSD